MDMYTVGQAKISALDRVRKEALQVFQVVNKYCPDFLKTKDVKKFVPCWQQILYPYLKKSLADSLKIYVLGSKLASLQKLEKARKKKVRRYSAARYEDRPELEIAVTEWVRRFCTPKAQRGDPVFLRECWGRYPGKKMSFQQFMQRWSQGQ